MHRAPRFAPVVEKDGVSRSGDSAQVKNSPSLRFLYKMRFKVTLSNRKPIIFQSLSIRIKHTTRLFSRKAPFEGDPSSGDAPKASALDSGSPGEPVGPGGCTREQTTSSRRRSPSARGPFSLRLCRQATRVPAPHTVLRAFRTLLTPSIGFQIT